MRTKTVNIFEVHELDEKAYDFAYEKWLTECNNYYDWDIDNHKSLEAFARLFPIKIKKVYEIGSQMYVRFEFDRYDNVELLEGERLAKWLYNNVWHRIYKGKYYSQKGRSRYSKVTFESSCPLTGYYMDDVLIRPIIEFMKRPKRLVTLEELLYECFDSWRKACSYEFEYFRSKQSFSDFCTLNDWEFDENGRRV